MKNGKLEPARRPRRPAQTALSPEMTQIAALAWLGAEVLRAVKESGLAKPKRRTRKVAVKRHTRRAVQVQPRSGRLPGLAEQG